MAAMPLVPETKVADAGKLISLGNLLVRKVTWLALTTTSATLILSRAFGADCMTSIAYMYILSSSKNSFFFISTHRDNTLSYTATYRDSTHPLTLSLLHFDFQQSTPENVYILQPFSFVFCLFGLTCFRFEHNHRNFVKPRKKQTTNMGEDTCFLAHVAIFLYIDTLHEILSPHTFYSLQDTFNILSFSIISVLAHPYTHAHAEEYSTDSS